jgi:hypothetical protein
MLRLCVNAGKYSDTLNQLGTMPETIAKEGFDI